MEIIGYTLTSIAGFELPWKSDLSMVAELKAEFCKDPVRDFQLVRKTNGLNRILFFIAWQSKNFVKAKRKVNQSNARKNQSCASSKSCQNCLKRGLNNNQIMMNFAGVSIYTRSKRMLLKAHRKRYYPKFPCKIVLQNVFLCFVLK